MPKPNLDSYPLVFRQQQQDLNAKSNDLQETKQQHKLDDNNCVDPALPEIDLESLNPKSLDEACRDWGILRVINHGVPVDLIRKLQEAARKVFGLSFDCKKDVFSGTPMSYFWGTPVLTPSGTSLSMGGQIQEQQINWVEGLNVPVGQLFLDQFQFGDQLLDDFRVLLEDYGNHVARVARTTFEAMTKNLSLEPEKYEAYLSESTGILRVYRYPQCAMPDKTIGMQVHTDSSVVSIILNDDRVGGLEALKDDTWIHVKSIPNTLVLNLGDMMQAISNDQYQSVKHRVTVNRRKERYSICYFVFPKVKCPIQSTKYKPFTYTDFQLQVQNDIKNLGLKVGLDRFKITEPT